MALSPVFPWSWLVVLGCVLCAAGLIVRFRRDTDQAFGRTRLTRNLVLTFSLLAALLFAIAAFDPQTGRVQKETRYHVVVVFDVSDSVLRSPEGLARIRQRAGRFLRAAIEDMDSGRVARIQATVVTFRGSALTARREIP